jgi:hypothetical protein
MPRTLTSFRGTEYCKHDDVKRFCGLPFSRNNDGNWLIGIIKMECKTLESRTLTKKKKNRPCDFGLVSHALKMLFHVYLRKHSCKKNFTLQLFVT